jgi:hypothetical protein
VLSSATINAHMTSAAAATSTAAAKSAALRELQRFVRRCLAGIREDMQPWVKSEFAGEFLRWCDAVADVTIAKHDEVGFPQDANAAIEWCIKAAKQGYDGDDAFFAMSMLRNDLDIVAGRCADSIILRNKPWLRKAAVEKGSARAQYVMGVFDNIQHGYARSKPDMLETARWFRMAAHQGFAPAQYELGVWFHLGVFCDAHPRFARKYVRRACNQGHPEAVERMAEFRRCVYCGANAAPRKCKLCREARYCSKTCSENHWRRGRGGDEDGAPHKHTCARTHPRH